MAFGRDSNLVRILTVTFPGGAVERRSIEIEDREFKVQRIDGIDQVHVVFARLETAIDYDAIDDRPVDLVALLLAPSDAGGAHLRALAKVSRRLRRQDMRQRLRAAPNVESLFTILTEDRKTAAA